MVPGGDDADVVLLRVQVVEHPEAAPTRAQDHEPRPAVSLGGCSGGGSRGRLLWGLGGRMGPLGAPGASPGAASGFLGCPRGLLRVQGPICGRSGADLSRVRAHPLPIWGRSGADPRPSKGRPRVGPRPMIHRQKYVTLLEQLPRPTPVTEMDRIRSRVRSWRNPGQFGHSLVEPGPILGQTRANLGRSRPSLLRNWSDLALLRPTSTDVGHVSAKVGPDTTNEVGGGPFFSKPKVPPIAHV